MFLLVIITFLTLLYYLKYKKNRKHLYDLANSLPGPKSLPIIGDTLIFATSQKELLRKFNNVDKQYKSMTKYWIGNTLHVSVKSPEHIEAIITKASTTKGKVYDILADCIGYGLIQSNGIKHKTHRKIMITPLKTQVLENFIHIFNYKGKECAENMNKFVNKELLDVDVIEKSAMALVFEVVLGIIMPSNNEENERLHEVINMLYKSVSERMYKIWLHPYILYRSSKHYKIQKEGMKVFNTFLTRIIKEKEEEANITYKDTKPMTSLEYLLDAKNNNLMTKEEVQEELITLFTASEDTTKTMTNFVLLMLAMHQDIQQKVWEEQIQILGQDLNITIEASHLKQMKYLNMVIDETLRLYPAAPLMVRKLTSDFKLDNVTLCKDVHIIINTFFAHRDENVWCNPEEFNPMRFTAEEIAKRHPYSYFPFSMGNRSCIGKHFAYIAIKCMVSHIIRKYVFHSDWKMSDIVVEADISCRSTNGYKMRIFNRE